MYEYQIIKLWLLLTYLAVVSQNGPYNSTVSLKREPGGVYSTVYNSNYRMEQKEALAGVW